ASRRPQRRREFPHGEADEHRREGDEEPRVEQQAHEQDAAERHPDGDRREQVAPGALFDLLLRLVELVAGVPDLRLELLTRVECVGLDLLERVPLARGRLGGRRALGIRVHQTSRSSASLTLRAASIWSTCVFVIASSSFSARAMSSSPTSLTRASRSSFALRRTLRMATLASSPLARTSFTYSLRRSSVSSGIVT